MRDLITGQERERIIEALEEWESAKAGDSCDAEYEAGLGMEGILRELLDMQQREERKIDKRYPPCARPVRQYDHDMQQLRETE